MGSTEEWKAERKDQETGKKEKKKKRTITEIAQAQQQRENRLYTKWTGPGEPAELSQKIVSERGGDVEKVLKGIMAKNSPNFAKDRNLLIQKVAQIPNRIN